ncbi:nucleobindin-2-like [Gasterosteus aculeatus]
MISVKLLEHFLSQAFRKYQLGNKLSTIWPLTTKDLHYNKSRHDKFKKYEMLKADERKEQLNTMSEEERRAEEQRYVEMRKKHGEHPKVNHPFKGSEDQLKEVWQESDGLDLDNFDPKTFLKIHDSKGDGFLDESKLEALYLKMEKVYTPSNEEDNMFEMEEERLRMREHVMNEEKMREYEQHLVNEENDINKKPEELYRQREELERKQK